MRALPPVIVVEMTEGKDSTEEGTAALEHRNGSSKRPPWWKRLWRWTKFGNKSGWNWLELLVVPFAIAGIGFWFTMHQDARQQQIEDQRAQSDALQAYLDQIGKLLLEKNLRNSEERSEVRTLARARTLTLLVHDQATFSARDRCS
jgi:hypothetical protein